METKDIIKQLRKEHHLTQDQLGEIVGVKKSAIAKYEHGAVQNLKRETIKKMADYFHVRPSYIMGISDEALTLSKSETEHIRKFRMLPEECKALIVQSIDVYYQNFIEKKENSI